MPGGGGKVVDSVVAQAMIGCGETMTTQYYSGPNYGGRLVGFLLALLLGAGVMVLLVRHAVTGRLGRLATLVTGRTTSFDTSVPVVVDKIQRLSRMETVVYSLDTVVQGEK